MAFPKGSKKIRIAFGILTGILFPFVCSYILYPPLLRNVRAGGGSWDICPPRNAEEEQRQKVLPVGIAPTLQHRLEQQFPTGTNEADLIKTLKEQGFIVSSHIMCKEDTTIHWAGYSKRGFADLEGISSNVVWKIDQDNKIIWIKGFVAYTFL